MTGPANSKKSCVICGEDLQGQLRVKDPHGRYFCEPCFERAKEAKRRRKFLEGVIAANVMPLDAQSITPLDGVPAIAAPRTPPFPQPTLAPKPPLVAPPPPTPAPRPSPSSPPPPKSPPPLEPIDEDVDPDYESDDALLSALHARESRWPPLPSIESIAATPAPQPAPAPASVPSLTLQSPPPSTPPVMKRPTPPRASMFELEPEVMSEFLAEPEFADLDSSKSGLAESELLVEHESAPTFLIPPESEVARLHDVAPESSSELDPLAETSEYIAHDFTPAAMFEDLEPTPIEAPPAGIAGNETIDANETAIAASPEPDPAVEMQSAPILAPEPPPSSPSPPPASPQPVVEVIAPIIAVPLVAPVIAPPPPTPTPIAPEEPFASIPIPSPFRESDSAESIDDFFAIESPLESPNADTCEAAPLLAPRHIASSPDEFAALADSPRIEQEMLLEDGPPAAAFAGCPHCHRPMPTGAIVCLGCGYNIMTGAVQDEDVHRPIVRRRTSRGGVLGPVMLGCAMTAGAAIACRMLFGTDAGLLYLAAAVLVCVPAWFLWTLLDAKNIDGAQLRIWIVPLYVFVYVFRDSRSNYLRGATIGIVALIIAFAALGYDWNQSEREKERSLHRVAETRAGE